MWLAGWLGDRLQRASWRWTCFEMKPHSPLCSATDSCWNRKLDSLTSSVMLAVRLPISCTSYTAWWCHVPPVSMDTGTNTWVLDSWLYLVFLLVAAWLAAAPASLAVLTRWKTAYVSGTLTSQDNGLPLDHGKMCYREIAHLAHLAASDQLVLWLRESVLASWLARWCRWDDRGVAVSVHFSCRPSHAGPVHQLLCRIHM